MEQAKYKLTINKDGIGCGLAYVSAVCQVAVVILLGVLILNDMIPLPPLWAPVPSAPACIMD